MSTFTALYDVHLIKVGWLENFKRSLRHNISPTDQSTACWLQYTPTHRYFIIWGYKKL